MKEINIGKDFSDTPLGRYPSDSNVSGERFCEEFLVPALKENDVLHVKIDTVEGYGSSFLEEAFGGLVRKHGYTPARLRTKMKIQCADQDFKIYESLIWKHIEEARLQPA